MFRKSRIIALAAATSLGALALSTNTASAFHIGGGGGMHFGAARVAGPHIGGGGLHFGRGLAYRRIVRVPPRLWPPGHWHWHYRWHFARPYWVAPVVATGVATTYAAAPTYNRCTCLTKEYTQEGAVVFKDVCTNEMAMNPPAVDTAPQGYVPQPMQQGALQPQPQPAQ